MSETWGDGRYRGEKSLFRWEDFMLFANAIVLGEVVLSVLGFFLVSWKCQVRRCVNVAENEIPFSPLPSRTGEISHKY